jgi:hypothetical protein
MNEYPAPQGYMPAPPPRPNTSAWRTCGCIFLAVLAVAVIGVSFAAYKFFNSGAFQQLVDTANSAPRVMADMTAIKQALDTYKADHKTYPKSLDALVPKYLPDKSKFTATYVPGRPKYFYAPPPADAPTSFTVLQIDMPPPFDIQGAPPWTIKMRLDGRMEGTNYNYTPGR